MTVKHAAAISVTAVLLFGAVTWGVIVALRVNPLSESSVIGTVLVDDTDVRKQMPVADVEITGSVGRTVATAKSDQAGFFRVTIPLVLRLNRTVTLHFERSGFKPLTIAKPFNTDLVIARLEPIAAQHSTPLHPTHTISNVRIRYTVQAESFLDVGTLVRTFEVKNAGDLPCKLKNSCSPDGQWKAAIGKLRLDAGMGNAFRNTRVSCIAGPCPFTRIEAEELSEHDRIFTIAARDWSDTAVFLVEADIVHSQIADAVRDSYPVVFGRGLSFTLPRTAAGPSLRAETDGQEILYPLGPDLLLSWATCTLTRDPDGSDLYSCELKPEYRFQ